MPLQIGEILAERYRITRTVKAGGFGAVFEAQDLRLEGPCAVKEMLETSDAWVHRRFKEEATLLNRLKHPHIPAVRDFFQVERISYIVMEFVRGHNLHEEHALLREKGLPGLDSEAAREVALTVLDVLEYLQSVEPPVLHRDIKPGNIIREESSGAIKLVDFGLARAPSDNTLTCAGTLQYSSPEQMVGQADGRSDLYSLGATLYYLVSGEPPRIGSPKPILALVPHLDVRLAEAIDRVIQANPEDRYPNAAAMREVLQRPLNSLPPQTSPRSALPLQPILVGSLLIGSVAVLQLSKTPQPAPSASPVALASATQNPDGGPRIVLLAAQPTLSKRVQVPRAHLLAAYKPLYEELKAFVDERKIHPGHSYCRYHSFGEICDIEYGMIVSQPEKGEGSIQASSLPAGPAARLIHRGNPMLLEDRYKELYAWIAHQNPPPGFNGGGWSLYVFLDPAVDPSQWITELYQPLQVNGRQ